MTEGLEWLVQLYDAWGKKDPAEQWRRKLHAATSDAKAAGPEKQP